MRLTRLVAVGLWAAAWLLPGAAVAAPIGDVTEVVNLATHQLPGKPKLQARLADPLLPEELLETAHEARLKVGFIDGSILVLEANSQAVLDRHLFDPAAAGRKAAVDLNAGLFLFTSGGHGDEGLMLRTPVTVIDLRGTILEVAVGLGGATEVTVIDGAVFVAPRGSGKGAMVAAGQMGRVASPDADVEVIDLVIPGAGGEHEQGTSASPDPVAEPPGPEPPGPEPPEPPGPEPPGPSAPGQSNGNTNNSGHSDGTNPGNGDEHGHDNGGSNNPGHGNKSGH